MDKRLRFFSRKREKKDKKGLAVYGIILLSVVTLFMCLFCSKSPKAPNNQEEKAKIGEMVETLERIYRNEPDRAIKLGRQALALLANHPDPDVECRIYSYLIAGMRHKGEYDEAKRTAKHVLRLAAVHKLRHRIAETHIDLANIHVSSGRFEPALTSLFSAREILSGLQGQDYLKGRLHNTLGAVYWHISNLSPALENFAKAEEYFQTTNNLIGLAAIYNNIGTIYIDMNEYSGAMNYLQKGLDAFRKTGNQPGVIAAHINIALVQQKNGDYKKSLDTYALALKTSATLNNLDQLSRIYNNMAEAWKLRGEYLRAEASYRKALQLRLKTNDNRGMAESWAGMAGNYRAMGRLADAEKAIRTSLSLTDSLISKKEKSQALLELFEIRKAQGDYSQALKAFKQYDIAAREISTDSLSQGLAGLTIGRVAEQKNREIQWQNHIRQVQKMEIERSETITVVIITVASLLAALTLLLLALFRFLRQGNRVLRQEIAAHEATQQRLRDSEAMFKTLALQSPLGIFILQNDKVKYINPQISQLSGFVESEIINHSPDALIHPDDVNTVQHKFQKALKERSSFLFEFRSVKQNGETIILKTYGVKITYEENPALLGTIVDITSARQLREELQRSREHESIARLAGGVAHDFNNLLAVVAGYLSLVRDSFLLPEHTMARLNTAEEKTNEIVAIVRSLLEDSGAAFINQPLLMAGNTVSQYGEQREVQDPR